MKPYYESSGIAIYLGDCREIVPALPSVDLVLTDPPYGISYNHGIARGPNASVFDLVKCYGDTEPFNPEFLMPLAPLHIFWGGQNYAARLPDSGGWLIWDKRCNTVVNDMSDAELAWTDIMNTTRIYYHVWDGFRRQTEKDIKRVHVMQKPVALMKWCLKFAPNAETVIDPFIGSGSVLIACKDTGRKAIGIEICERYCEIAARRLEQEVLDFGDAKTEVLRDVQREIF